MPADVVEILQLKEGDELEFSILDSRVLVISKKIDEAQRLARLRAFRGKMPKEFKFDRTQAEARD